MDLKKFLLGIVENDFWCKFYLDEKIIFLALIWRKYNSIWFWGGLEKCNL